MESRSAIVFLAVVVAVSATSVNPCGSDQSAQTKEELSKNVQLNSCVEPPCTLKKGTSPSITIRFTPETDITAVTSHVSAVSFGALLPFIGADRVPVCDKIFTESGEKASCALTAGTTYIYKDTFSILSVYPAVSVNIQWSLKDTNENDIICYVVPATITN